MSVPARLDALVLRRLPASQTEAGTPAGGTATAAGDSERQLLFGAWLVATVALAVGSLVLGLAVASWPVRAVSALVTGVPASMAVLRGVADAVSPRGRLPKYTTSTATWLVCYLVATGGLMVAFVG
jgi:hypothetical protein